MGNPLDSLALHKASTDIFLAQLHGMTNPTKVAGPSTIDMTTPSPMDRLKLMFQTPPTPKAVHNSTRGSLGAVGNGSDPDSDPFSHGSARTRGR